MVDGYGVWSAKGANLYAFIKKSLYLPSKDKCMIQNFAAIDFETANRHPGSVCSVGLVVVREGAVTDRFYGLIQPEPNFYHFQNTRVHGLQATDTDAAPVFPHVWEQVAARIAGLPLVAHNSLFDEGCLKAAFRTYGMDYPDYAFRCTCRAARRAFPQLADYKLHTVAAACGVQLKRHHHALADAEACAAIALAILRSEAAEG
jgi:DNA polymerase-3 subunit epsilon